MESGRPVNTGATTVGLARLGARVFANARFEAVLLVLVLLTVAAMAFQDQILERTTRYTPAIAASYYRHTFADHDLGGNSTVRELGPFHWDCELRAGYAYPYCGYELYFDPNQGMHGLDLTNLRSIELTMVYHGTAPSFRVHLKNFDPHYSKAGDTDSPKFMRVEFATTPGKLQHVVFQAADFGVADWWLRKMNVPPQWSHPQFDNITSMNIETGSEAQAGRHDFEVREVVVHRVLISETHWLQGILCAWAVLIAAYLAYRFFTMRREVEQRRALHAVALQQAEAAEAAARHDPLTKILNRRGVLDRYAEIAEVGPVPLGIIMIDIDRFKQLNDTFGHNYGDEVLCSVAALIRRNARSGDTVGRWGGEEFLVLCPGLEAEGTMLVAECIRTRIEHFHFGDCERVTASFGVHWCPAAATGLELSGLVALADLALYTAKEQGRNRALRFGPSMSKAA
jgi:diguanylate cyclase (GGDEF)-like protein